MDRHIRQREEEEEEVKWRKRERKETDEYVNLFDSSYQQK